MTDQGWGRAQYMELLDCEGATLAERDEQVMASKELSGELKRRRERRPEGREGEPQSGREERWQERERESPRCFLQGRQKLPTVWPGQLGGPS